MLQLREDLILIPAHGRERFSVRDPETGAVFEFGEQEAFLIEALRGPYDPLDLMAAFSARFGLDDGPENLREFLDILANWRLLATTPDAAGTRSGDVLPTVERPRSAIRPLSEATAALRDSSVPAGAAAIGTEQDKPSAVEAEIQRDNRWHLFRPEGMFDALDRALSPLRKLVWLTPLVVAFSIAAVWFNRHIVADALATAKLQFGLIGRLMFAALTVNLAVQLLRGVVARHLGLRVPSFGMVLVLGLMPRFNTQIVSAPHLGKRDRLWLISTSLLVRLGLFGAGVALWLTTRSSGSLLSIIGAELALVSAVSFLFAANPLLGGDGYNLMSVALGVPNLRQRARNALRALFKGRPRVIAKYAKDSFPLLLFAFASVIFPAALVVFISVSAARRLESDYQGAGIALFLVILVYVIQNALRRARSRKEAKRRRTAGVAIQEEENGPRPLLRPREPQIRSSEQPATGSEPSRPVQTKRLRYLVFTALFAALFLPYSYETGGEAEIFPIAGHKIYAEIDGVIEQVFYEGGEWVTKGTVIAEMANHRQRKDVATTRAAIDAKQKEIDRLRSTPSPEAVRLAEQQLDTARLESRYSSEDAHRIEKLYAKNTVSAQEWERAKKQRDVDLQQVEEKRAALDALRAQVNPNEIAAAEADLQKLREELAYFQEQLRRTSLRMPIDGRIATTKLKDLQNKYLEEGMLFADVEDSREVRVEIAIPQADAFDIRQGNRIRLKTWADPSHIVAGTVIEIAPLATEETYGKVVKVTALLPNPTLAMKTGMTGYAKIEAEDTRVVVAFTKALVRFFLVEMWSWLP